MNKILDYVLKGVIGLIVSSGGYQIFDGRWFGAAIFNNYLHQRQVGLVGRISDDLYRDWGLSSVQSSLAQISPSAMFLSVLLLIGLVVHIISKRDVAAELGTPVVAGPSFKKRAWLSYVRLYHWLTLIIILCLMYVYFFLPLAYGLALLFLLIVVPSALYLLLYSKDFLQGKFIERFVCICLLFLLVASLVEWPALYGRRVFSPEFPLVTLANQNPDSCSADLQKGPIFLAWQPKDKTPNQFFRMCFNKTGYRFIDFFESGDPYQVSRSASLTSVIDSFVPPVSVEEGDKAIADALKKLQRRPQ